MFYLTQFQRRKNATIEIKSRNKRTGPEVLMNVHLPLIGICELCQGPKWWWPLKGPVLTQKPDSCGRGCPHVFFTRWESERKLCVKSPVHTGEWTEGRAPSPFARCQVFRKKQSCISVERNKLDTVLTLFNAMQFNATRTHNSITEAVPL